MQVVGLQTNLQGGAIAHCAIQVQGSLRQADVAVRKSNQFRGIRVPSVDHAVERNRRSVAVRRSNGSLQGCVGLCNQVVKSSSPGSVGIGIDPAGQRHLL